MADFLITGSSGGSIPVFTGATESTNGTSGLVPAPLAGQQGLFLEGNGTWATPPGGGNVTGAVSSTNDAIVRWNGTSGTLIQNSLVIIDDSGNVTGIAALTATQVNAGTVNNTSADLALTTTTSGNITLAPASGGIVQLSGITYPTAGGTSGQVLTSNGSGVLSLQTIPTQQAYSTVDNQGTPLTQRSVLNFTGAAVTAVDNSGATRTDVTFASNLNTIAGFTPTSGYTIVGNGAAYTSAAGDNVAINYSPTHYSATASTVDGNLQGIDNALGTISGAAITALTGDVVATGPGSVSATIQSNVVTNAKLAQMPTDTIKGNNTGVTANAADLTGTQVTALLTPFVGDSGSGGTKGIVPAPGANTYLSGDYLNAGGTWSYVDQSKTRYADFSLVTQGPVPAGSPGTIKYESTTIFTSIVTGKNYAIGVGFIGSPTLTIWDISDQTAPTITGTFVAAGGGAYNCTIGVVSGVQYAFVGYNSGSHFVVVNLTNLAAPTQTSSTVITGSPGSIYGVSFLNGYVYCATQSAGLVVMDVGGGTGSPAVPVQTYTQGSPVKSFGVVAIGTNVYTTQFSTASPFTIRQIISWTLTGLGTPAVPSLIQSLQVTAAGEALGLSISGNTAFVTTAATGAYNINLVDITTPSAMTNLSQINSTNNFNSAFFAVANGNYLYVPSGSNATYGGAVDAYDITIRTTPIHIAQVTTGDPTSVFGGIALSGGYIFCADYGIVASNNGYLDVFTQIDAVAIIGEMHSSTAYILSLTPNTALVSSASDEVISSVTTATELSYVHGVTSSIQAQINAINAGQLIWNVITTNTAIAKDNGYFTNSGSQVTVTLPSTAAVGDTFSVSNIASGGFLVAQNAGQLIQFGDVTTTTGTGGSLASTHLGDTVTLVCAVANTKFVGISSMGNLIVV
jgi:hypothetical protein